MGVNVSFPPAWCFSLGAGFIGPRVVEFSGWLPNFGVGYRFEVQPRMNLRLDVGVSADVDGPQPALYFNFNEAF